MSGTLSIRRYEPADAEAVKALHEEWSWDVEHPESEHQSMVADLDDIEGEYLDAGGEFLVGYVDDQLVATGAYVPVDDTTVELGRIKVDTEYQREGYGTELLDALEQRAESAGYSKAIIDEMGLNTRAQAFLEAKGYEETDRANYLGTELLSFRKAIA